MLCGWEGNRRPGLHWPRSVTGFSGLALYQLNAYESKVNK